MDALVWWSSGSDRVRQDMSSEADGGRYRPMRWLPLLPMAWGAGFVLSAIAFPMPLMSYAVAGPAIAAAAAIAINGPLGKPSIDDDEREAALRKNAFLFCLAILAFVNIVGGPILLFTAGLNEWTAEHLTGVSCALFMGNMTWFVTLPTLYASWRLP
jgi:hypothetical protein